MLEYSDVLINGTGFLKILIILFFSIISFILYFLPSIIVAFNKKHDNRIGLFILNFLLGWTMFAWIAALIWSFHKPK